MTTSVATNPALASLAVAAASGSPAGATGVAVPPVSAAEPHEAKASAGPATFPALLLGLCAAGGATDPAVNEATAATVATGSLPTDAAAIEPAFKLPGLGSTAELSLSANPAGGKQASNPLPANGKDLPPPDVETLLASLGLPAGAADMAIAAGPTPPLDNPVQPAAGYPTLSPTAAQSPQTTLTQASTQGPAASLALLQSRDQTLATADAPTTVAAWHDDSTVPADPADSPGNTPAMTDNALPDVSANTAGQRGLALALPAEFRTRLDTLLAAAHRPDTALDTGTISSSSFATNTGASSPGVVTHGSSATGSPFDVLPVLRPLSDSNAWSQGLGERLLLMADKGLQSATIKLHPEQLGPMQIRIQVDEDGTAQVLFSAHHAQTRDALELAIPRLRDMFAEQGLSLMQANVDSGRSTFAQRDFASSLETWRNWADDEPDSAPDQNPAIWRISHGSPRRVDVFV